jgi:hypothetical protein
VCECNGLVSRARNESEGETLSLLRCQSLLGDAASPGFLLCERFEVEHTSYDPKGGELYLCRVKPGETLVEARRGTDVQIVRPTWV